ncbi:MAG: Hsp70 family protein, partial [Calditrichaeota bacterium]|nr:Hsp70 family protein [Calditrichota bacterium]
PPAPRGVPQIEVTFDIDANGILAVKAKDKATNKEQSIKITANSGLSDAEIERMKKEAEAHAADDAKRKEEVELKNSADQKVFQTKKQLEELKEQITAEDRSGLETAVARIETALKGEDTEEIKSASEALETLWNDVSKRMYENAQNQAGGSGAEGGPQGAEQGEAGSTDNGAVDADFEVVDDKKKG